MKNYIRKLLKEENLENPPKPEVGDILYCHTTLEMEDDGSEEAIEGKEYEVKGYSNYNDFWITNESGHNHNFGTKRDESSLYTKWFTLIPPDIRDIDFFGQLYEQEEDEFEWARNAINLRRAVVTSRGEMYSTYLYAMARTAVPEAMECAKKIQQKFNLDDGTDISGNILWREEERQRLHRSCTDHLKDIGIITPQISNGDLCYVWPTPFYPSESNDVIYHLERISDGKHFVIGKDGFRFVDESFK